MENILLQAENLCYSYEEGTQVLKEINLTVRKGEKVAVLGSNGAGKSTCFLNLNGVLQPDSGRIFYDGKEIKKKDFNELRKHVGIVFQDADHQIIASTVFAEVSFGPMNLRLPKEEVVRRVKQALSDMNLTGMKDRPPHYLSGGEKKRVSIADILAMESEVVIFDEPTASLDPANVEMLKGILDKMAVMGKTLLISTHDVDFAYEWADRAVVFAHGRIIADGSMTEIFKRDEVLKEANLRKPVLLEVWNSLIKHEILDEKEACPRNAGELEILLEKSRSAQKC
ncbi:MAG: ABC transporter ATP-binding protein [Lacrimispora sp.]|uniref:energy-coupling factor ABC transporter ATP-binding protein n=1 Tax=Lacrimispora sp. TaxID=2719234 RepID=UPI0039E68A89